ncbi:TPA: hypothetical protein GX533_00260 [Candidatus Dojkabacteria bacterium]|uniref:Uncharacterized protein n=1 Tax=Candidatus Dojkabacteria bacterium TaxID=2099670 RepID=A0A832QBU4_9BACT|nr:hypothetical protein [Candidatus Dojkabacteria bacterium]
MHSIWNQKYFYKGEKLMSTIVTQTLQNANIEALKNALEKARADAKNIRASLKDAKTRQNDFEVQMFQTALDAKEKDIKDLEKTLQAFKAAETTTPKASLKTKLQKMVRNINWKTVKNFFLFLLFCGAIALGIHWWKQAQEAKSTSQAALVQQCESKGGSFTNGMCTIYEKAEQTDINKDGQTTQQQPNTSINSAGTNPEGANVQPGPVVITVTNPDDPNNPEQKKINYGTYVAKYNRYSGIWDIALDEDYLVGVADKNLADIKREGAIITFTMPADGWINNSAGLYLTVGGVEWDFGNYAEGVDGMKVENMISKGTPIVIAYQPNNISAGFSLKFKNN